MTRPRTPAPDRPGLPNHTIDERGKGRERYQGHESHQGRWQAVARWFVGLGLAAAAAVGSAQPAVAHDQLIESTPAEGSTSATPPAEVTLLFSNEVLDLSTQIVVNDAAGAVVLDTEGVAAGPKVTAPFPAELAAGAYTVAWRVVSGDGHPIQGSFAFAVAEQRAPTPTTSAAPEAPPATPPAQANQEPAASSTEGSATAEATGAPEVADDDEAAGTEPRSLTPVWVGLGGAALLAAVVGVAVRLRRRSQPPTP